jgi:hypothetical protein
MARQAVRHVKHHRVTCTHPGCQQHSEHQEVWAGPSWSSTASRYDVAFIWSIIRSITVLSAQYSATVLLLTGCDCLHAHEPCNARLHTVSLSSNQRIQSCARSQGQHSCGYVRLPKTNRQQFSTLHDTQCACSAAQDAAEFAAQLF